MDQETAQRLLSEGAFFILLNVPEGTEFGIDMKTWNVGERFRGIKMIPPGLHFIFYSSVSLSNEVAPRTGFFHNFRKGEVIVKKWDKQKEQISEELVSENEIVNIKENLRTFDSFLGPYPYDILGEWSNLCSNVTENVLKKLVPLSGLISSALELQPCLDVDRPRGVKRSLSNDSESSSSSKEITLPRKSLNELLPSLKPKEGTAIRLTKFPDRNYPEGSSPAEITKHSLDLTYVLEILLQSYTSPEEIIGELEFCYICFLVGHSFEAFDQWKKIVTLFCTCDAALIKHRKLYDNFVSVLGVQLKEIPEEFLADIVSNDNFVYVNLRTFFRNAQMSNLDGQLKTKIERFKESLSTTYMWDFSNLESEDEDDAPVVVEIRE